MEAFWKAVLSLLPCVICVRFVASGVPPSLHHVAPGSSVRSVYGMCPLCEPHHQGPRGFHSEPKEFVRVFRPPFDSEVGLLVWVMEDLAKLLFLKCRFLGRGR